MNSLRQSIVSIPVALTGLISDGISSVASHIRESGATATTSAGHSSSTASDSDDWCTAHAEKSLPIPASLVKEQWRLLFTADANAQDLEESIAHCYDLVLATDECSAERKWLVRHLVDLRFSLKELKDAEQDPHEMGPTVKTVVGHHFVASPQVGRMPSSVSRRHCDHCTGIIWGVVQMSYVCSDCQYVVHQKCIDSVVRVCAHVVAMERQYPIAEMCPEIGLAAQSYKCAECEMLLNCNPPINAGCFGQSPREANSWIEPRLCDYNGLYYCPSCHWNDSSIIPARVVHNWDFEPRKVSRASLQEIKLFLDMPLINLEEANPKLFVFLEKLCLLKKLRQNLVHMRKYLSECRCAANDKLFDNEIGGRRHLVQSDEYYSVSDLEQAETGILGNFLRGVHGAFDAHIRNCSMCTAKAYICEICSNNEVIYPFDDGCILCSKCNSIFHRVCITRKNMTCPKCVRVQDRKLMVHIKSSDHNDDNDNDNGDDDDDD